MYVRNLWPLIHISHRFAFKLHILHKSDNTIHWVIAYRRSGKRDSVKVMKNWEEYAASFDVGLNRDNITMTS